MRPRHANGFAPVEVPPLDEQLLPEPFEEARESAGGQLRRDARMRLGELAEKRLDVLQIAPVAITQRAPCRRAGPAPRPRTRTRQRPFRARRCVSSNSARMTASSAFSASPPAEAMAARRASSNSCDTQSSAASSKSSFERKWKVTVPGDTPACRATFSMVVSESPSSAMTRIAASRICRRRSACGRSWREGARGRVATGVAASTWPPSRSARCVSVARKAHGPAPVCFEN